MIVNKPKKKKKSSRYTTFFTIMIIIFTIITGKLVYLQVLKYDDYVERANNTSTKFVSEKAPRGIIYDAKGNVLATNKQTYAVKYTSTTEADASLFSTIDKIIDILSINGEGLDDTFILKVDENDNPYFDYTATTDVGKRIEEIRFKRDRNFNDDIEKELFGEDYNKDLTDDENAKVNDLLIEISPKQVFCDLVKKYGLISLIDPNPSEEREKEYKEMTGEQITNLLLDKYTYSDLRKYILVKDQIKMQSYKGYKSVTIASNISKDTYLMIVQSLDDLLGIDIKVEPTRYYPYNELASSVLGYLSPIDSSNSEKYELRGYDVSTDLIGVSGIEAAFEDQLKGTKGGTTVKVNSSGRITEELFKLESYPGNSVHLTIDKDIQYAAEQSLIDTMEKIRSTSDAAHTFKGANRGAVIAVDVNSGKILASVSYPNYDPNKFAISGQLTSEENAEYFSPDLEIFGTEIIQGLGLNKSVDELFPKDENGLRKDQYDLYPRPFYNYATQGLVPPGSIFKPLTSVAGLESGVITPDSTIVDRGKFTEHPDVYGGAFGPECLIYSNYHGTHGALDVSGALEVSCNYFFYEVAYRLYTQALSNGLTKAEAVDSLAKYAWKFGLGVDPNGQQNASTGIEIEENFGQVYNFQSFKNQSILYGKFELRDYLETGNYKGITYFVPFDYSTNDEDIEVVSKAKESLKDKINKRFSEITGNDTINTDEFTNVIIDDVKTIMNNSEKYKQNVVTYESSGKGTVSIDKQAAIVAQVISRFVTNDKRSEILSPAQEVYAAIGQGMNTFTPMQLAQYISTIANGGTRYSLHYVDKITSPEGEILQEFQPQVLDSINMSEETWKAVVEGMKKVNNDEEGTATSAFNGFPAEITTAGKTGTADFSETQYENGRAPFATYISFAPADSPEIAVVAVVYDGGHGGYVAPVARAVYEAYFKDRILEIDPNYAAKSESFQKYVVNGLGNSEQTT
ncbi:MAG: penicillin-binding transpeptidase domain-containing protein [Clostridiaceae bacterium]|nr:penicillin-binding transpeptidase domain-containing protein [Clostridiaceae bacterium]